MYLHLEDGTVIPACLVKKVRMNKREMPITEPIWRCAIPPSAEFEIEFATDSEGGRETVRTPGFELREEG